MATLNEYLRDRPKGEFADRLGINRAYLSQILSGYRTPSFKLMRRIEEETDGEVSLYTWSPSSRPSTSLAEG